MKPQTTTVATTRNGQFSPTFWLSLATSIWVFVVNTFGFVDTFTGSSLSLGRTWPFTHDGLVPKTWDIAKFIEYTHRVLVSVLLILLIALTVLIWRKYRRWLELKVLNVVAVLFVLAEAFLGAMAVLFASPPAVTALHMGVALVSFCSVVGITSVLGQIDRRNLQRGSDDALRPYPISKQFTRFAWFACAYVLIAIYFGSYVARTGAGGSFRGWPLPTESESAVGTSFFWIDIIHRTLALGMICLFVGLTIAGYRVRNVRRDLLGIGVAALVLTCLQAVSGALLIYTHLSMAAFLIHVCVVTAIFAVTGVLAIQALPELHRSVKRGRTPSTETRRPARA